MNDCSYIKQNTYVIPACFWRESRTLWIPAFAGMTSCICFLSIVSADNDSSISDGLRDVKAPVYFPTSYILLFIILFLLLAGGIVAFIYSRREKKAKKEEIPVDPRAPWEIAYDQLDELGKSSLLARGQFKEYYSQLSGIVRLYFENRFKIRAPEMTTEEFLWSLEESGVLTVGQKGTLKKFMNSCDIVKFAKHIPGTQEAQESFVFARQLIEETK